MGGKRQSTISSIFGDIERVIADAMVAEGKVTKIPPEQIPEAVRFDKAGRQAYCALVFRPGMEIEFDERVRNLRA